jgi:hypothetical protein
MLELTYSLYPLYILLLVFAELILVFERGVV